MIPVAALACTCGNASGITKDGGAVWAAPSLVADTTVVTRAAVVTGGGLRHRRRAQTTDEEASNTGEHPAAGVEALTEKARTGVIRARGADARDDGGDQEY